MTQRVKDKSIIVTGAGGGIGEGIARRLADQGAQVLVNDINVSQGERVVASITEAGGRASFFAADVTRSADVAALVDAVVAFSNMAAQLGEKLLEAEINPLFVLPQGVRAADAVVLLA